MQKSIQAKQKSVNKRLILAPNKVGKALSVADNIQKWRLKFRKIQRDILTNL